ncbi:MAG: hypothetical protein KDA73_14785 [Rhodobacteraceae bacterium]|nr:hypothetical protein [Paracoccaceae bacterium]
MPFFLPPLVSLAVSVLPNLAKRVADNVLPGVETKLTNTVKEVLGTDDIAVAEEKLQDPKVAAELRVRLAEIEVEADKVEADREAAKRQAELNRFKSELADTQNARSTLVQLAESGSDLKWAPAAVSLVVVVGFFGTLFYLIYLLRHPAAGGTNNDAVIQIVNIAVGALTAGFATVVSFWLGSSQGSRDKDRLNIRSQQAASAVATEQSRQTAQLIGQIASAPPRQITAAAPPQAGKGTKDARQFRRCVDLVLGFEGGFSDHPADPGGATNMGITMATLTAWRKKMAEPGVAVSVTVDDVRNLDRDEAIDIYRANYWNALNCDNLPAGVDLVVFDFGVNAGPVRSAKMLQKVVHVDQDGQVGKITTGAADSIDPAHIINAFDSERMDFYRSLSTFETFGKGWTRRTQEIGSAALEMANG